MLLHLDMCSSHMNFGLSGLCEKQNPKQEERQTYLGEASFRRAVYSMAESFCVHLTNVDLNS